MPKIISWLVLWKLWNMILFYEFPDGNVIIPTDELMISPSISPARWVRGAPEDYDRWAEEFGCSGWSALVFWGQWLGKKHGGFHMVSIKGGTPIAG